MKADLQNIHARTRRRFLMMRWLPHTKRGHFHPYMELLRWGCKWIHSKNENSNQSQSQSTVSLLDFLPFLSFRNKSFFTFNLRTDLFSLNIFLLIIYSMFYFSNLQGINGSEDTSINALCVSSSILSSFFLSFPYTSNLFFCPFWFYPAFLHLSSFLFALFTFLSFFSSLIS